jgi:hypothetical protein
MLLAKYQSDDQVKNYEVGGLCGSYEGKERFLNSFGRKNVEKRLLERFGTRWEDGIKKVP